MALRGAIYRDASDGKRAYLEALRAEQALGRMELAPAYRRVRAARVARAAAGATLAAAGALMFVTAIARFARDTDVHRYEGGGLTALLLLGWGAAVVVYAVARVAVWARFPAHLDAELAPTGDVDLDLERARRPVAQVAHGMATRPERGSLVWPLVGLALVMPLTLHYAVAVIIGEPGIDHADFDRWIVGSAILVGHCHLIVALRARRFGHAFTSSPDPIDPSRAGSRTWGFALAASLFPGLILFAIPTFLVALTGVFIPIAFAFGAARVTSERDALESAG